MSNASSCTLVEVQCYSPKTVELMHIHRQSAYLVGRDRLVADIALDHPSCSKQHAVFQCKLVVICVQPKLTSWFRSIRSRER